MAGPICSTAAVCLVSLFALPWNCSVGRANEIGQATDSNSPQQPAEVLVLRDGGVLAGTITRAGDRYVVTRAGSEIQVPAANVLVACDRLEDAYEHRRAQITRPSAAAHLALAEWCLRHGLLPQAARELVDAGGLEPRHPRLKLLERRLMAASKPRARQDDHVVPVSHTETATTSQRAHKEPAVSDVAAIDELPPGAVERFTRRVQPILVNTCTISGCHQPGGKQEFQLDRALLHGLANRRSTTKNLAATLALVDRDEPQASPLLTVPRRPHGGTQSAIFGPRQLAAVKHLEEWVTLVTTPMEQQELPVAEAEPNAIAEVAPQLRPLLKSTVSASSGVNEALYTESLYTETYEDAAPTTSRLQYGAQLQPWQPKDPFDPEIFNRQQRSRRQARGNVNAQAVTEHQ